MKYTLLDHFRKARYVIATAKEHVDLECGMRLFLDAMFILDKRYPLTADITELLREYTLPDIPEYVESKKDPISKLDHPQQPFPLKQFADFVLTEFSGMLKDGFTQTLPAFIFVSEFLDTCGKIGAIVGFKTDDPEVWGLLQKRVTTKFTEYKLQPVSLTSGSDSTGSILIGRFNQY